MTGTAGEIPFAFESIAGRTYLLTEQRVVRDGAGERQRWWLNALDAPPDDAVTFDAAYSATLPPALAGIAAADGGVAAWLWVHVPGNTPRIERLGIDGERRAWTLPETSEMPAAYRLAVTAPADHAFVWLFADQADARGPRPLLQVDADGVQIRDDDVVWASCDGGCRYLVEADGAFVLKDASGNAGRGYAAQGTLRAACGDRLVTEARRYAVAATGVTVERAPAGWATTLVGEGRLACNAGTTRWMWMSPGAAYALAVTERSVKPVFTLSSASFRRYGAVTAGKAAVAFAADTGTDTVTCDNEGRPAAESCVADYDTYATVVSETVLK